jgi:hypothetical protein
MFRIYFLFWPFFQDQCNNMYFSCPWAYVVHSYGWLQHTRFFLLRNTANRVQVVLWKVD